MKFATLMMVATVAAAASTCPVLTADEKKKADEYAKTSIGKAAIAKAKTEFASASTKLNTEIAADKTALTKCHSDNKITTAADIKTADTTVTGKCYIKATTLSANEKALHELKCAQADVAGSSLIIIIICVVVALCITAGCLYYFCHHKKKGEE